MGIARQIVMEGMVIAAGGCLVAIAVGRLGTMALAQYLPHQSGLMERLGLDSRDVIFVSTISAASMALCAAIPAIQSFTAPLRSILSATGIARRKHSTDRAMVMGQIALSLVLLVSAALFGRTLSNLREIETGLDEEHVIEFSLRGAYGSEWRSLVDQGLAEHLGSLPQVEHVTRYGGSGLFQGLFSGPPITMDVLPEGTDSIAVPQMAVGLQFFQTMGVPMLSGRSFIAREMRATSEFPRVPVVVISESLAQYMWGDQDPVGRWLSLIAGDQASVLTEGRRGESRFQVIGVARDAEYFGLRERSPWLVYHPEILSNPLWTRFAVRVEGDTRGMMPVIRSAVEEVAGELRIGGLEHFVR